MSEPSAKKKVLQDHRQKGPKFVPPFIAAFGQMHEIGYRERSLPELLWIGLLMRGLGEVEGTAEALRISKLAIEIGGKPIYGLSSEFRHLDLSHWNRILGDSLLERESKWCLTSLLACYPDSPLRVCALDRNHQAEELQFVRDTVEQMFFRNERFAMMVQASSVYLAFVNDRLRSVAGTSLLDLPEMENYPDTELSQRVAAGVRCTVNAFVGEMSEEWAAVFWRRGSVLAGCSFE